MDLKPKEEMFVQAYLKHRGNGTKAYLDVHPDIKEVSARVNASRLLANISIRLKISEELSRQGLDIVELIKKLKDLTEARADVNNDGDFTGWVPDNRTRLEAIKFACKLHGLIGSGTGENLIFMTPEEVESLTEEQKPKTEEEI